MEEWEEWEEDEEEDDPSETWLHKMDGYLDWKVIGPRINNPYEKPLPDRVLFQMANKAEHVRQHLKIRCLCDGHEVLSIDNLSQPILTTDHPCLTILPKSQILNFMDEIGLEEEILKTIDRIQGEIRDELKSREHRLASESTGPHKTMAQARAEREKASAKGGGKKKGGGRARVRVVRR